LDEFAQQLAKLSPGYLFQDPRTNVHSPLYLVAAVVFAIVLIGGLLALLYRERLTKGNRLHLRILERYATWAASVGGVGLTVILLRYANVPLFSKRAWSVLNVLAVVALFAHFMWYKVKIYPEQIAAYREEERKRRFLPTAKRPVSIRRPRRRR
jgi:hypothetical protein